MSARKNKKTVEEIMLEVWPVERAIRRAVARARRQRPKPKRSAAALRMAAEIQRLIKGKTTSEILREGTAVDLAVRLAVMEAVAQHRRARGKRRRRKGSGPRGRGTR
jgi:hypothetical protein